MSSYIGNPIVVTEFTMNKTREEYVADAMLLGLFYSVYHHVFIAFSKNECYDPDTLTPLPLYHTTYSERCRKVVQMRAEMRNDNK